MSEDQNAPLHAWLVKNRWNFSLTPATMYIVVWGVGEWIKRGAEDWRWRWVLTYCATAWLLFSAILAWVVWPLRQRQIRTRFPYSTFAYSGMCFFGSGGTAWFIISGWISRGGNIPGHVIPALCFYVMVGLVWALLGVRAFLRAIRIAASLRQPPVDVADAT